MSSNGIYEGRLQTDGNGNLLAYDATIRGQQLVPLFDGAGNPMLNADGTQITMLMPILDVGPSHGLPVAAHDGSYVFVSPGDPSHNERHQQNVLGLDPTQDVDPELPGFAGNDEADGIEGTAHHFGVLPDDPHYQEGATNARGLVNNTNARLDPDSVAHLVTGHTAAYTKEA